MSDNHYPAAWDEFIGQDRAKRQLQLAAKSARLRGAPAAHILLEGGKGGVGKTALARLMAKEIGTSVREVSGPVRVEDVRRQMWEMTDGDVLFYDEIHRVVEGGKHHGEWLLHALAEGILLTALGREEMPQITIVGATTDVGRLPETITGRFRRIALTPYTDQEATLIAQRMAKAVFGRRTLPSLVNCQGLAAAANNNPRAIEKLLEQLRDMAVARAIRSSKTGYDLAALFELLDLTTDGLDSRCRAYLHTLLADFNGGPAGQAAMADRLNEPGGVAANEQLLMDKGLITKTPQGRQLTAAGVARVRVLAA